MNKGFETGRYYRWNPKRRKQCLSLIKGFWNSSGLMDFMLDGKPHKCINGDPDMPAGGSFPHYATFEESPYREWMWLTSDLNFDDFFEVVDVEEKQYLLGL